MNLKKAIKIIDIALEKQDKDYDSVFVIVGKERIGKSNLMLHLYEHAKGQINNLALDRSYFIKALYNCQWKGIVCLDEAGDTLFSRDAMTNFNKDLVKTYQVIGGKCLLTFLVLPDFFMLDRYFREHRVRGLFFVYKRGRYAFYNPAEIKKIIEAGDKWIPLKMKVTDSFPKYQGVLLEAYLKKKEEKINNTLLELKNKYEKPEDNPAYDIETNKELRAIITKLLINNGIKINKVAEILKVSSKTIYNYNNR